MKREKLLLESPPPVGHKFMMYTCQDCLCEHTALKAVCMGCGNYLCCEKFVKHTGWMCPDCLETD